MKKEQALERISVLEKETRELRKIIESPEKPEKITDRVKSFEDACYVLCIDPKSVFNPCEDIDVIAYKKLRVIVRALREGWEPEYKNINQKKWFPIFDLSSGFAFTYTNDDWANSYTNASSGIRLVLPTEELAIFAGKTFLKEFEAFLTVQK